MLIRDPPPSGLFSVGAHVLVNITIVEELPLNLILHNLGVIASKPITSPYSLLFTTSPTCVPDGDNYRIYYDSFFPVFLYLPNPNLEDEGLFC